MATQMKMPPDTRYRLNMQQLSTPERIAWADRCTRQSAYAILSIQLCVPIDCLVEQMQTTQSKEAVAAMFGRFEPCPHDTDMDGDCHLCTNKGGCPVIGHAEACKLIRRP